MLCGAMHTPTCPVMYYMHVVCVAMGYSKLRSDANDDARDDNALPLVTSFRCRSSSSFCGSRRGVCPGVGIPRVFVRHKQCVSKKYFCFNRLLKFYVSVVEPNSEEVEAKEKNYREKSEMLLVKLM